MAKKNQEKFDLSEYERIVARWYKGQEQEEDSKRRVRKS